MGALRTAATRSKWNSAACATVAHAFATPMRTLPKLKATHAPPKQRLCPPCNTPLTTSFLLRIVLTQMLGSLLILVVLHLAYLFGYTAYGMPLTSLLHHTLFPLCSSVTLFHSSRQEVQEARQCPRVRCKSQTACAQCTRARSDPFSPGDPRRCSTWRKAPTTPWWR